MATLRNSSQMFPIVEAWQQSRQTQEVFSEQIGISKHVLSYWVCRYRKAHPSQERLSSANTPSFVEISTPRGSAASMEIALPTGVVIRFSGTVPLTYLRELLKVCSL